MERVYDSGQERRRRAQGAKADELQNELKRLDPQLAEWADDYIFGQVWARPGLSDDERMMVAITALAVGGHLNLMKNYLHGALQARIPQKLHELLVMLNVYVGFPATIEALHEWRSVLESSVRHGVVAEAALEEQRR